MSKLERLHDEITDLMSLNEDERRAEAIKSTWESVERAVNEIALCRRNVEVTYDIEPEEFDKRLNEMCEAAYKKFGNMTKEQIGRYMLMEIMKGALGV